MRLTLQRHDWMFTLFMALVLLFVLVNLMHWRGLGLL